MNDRELLELAAKAAGYEVKPFTWNEGMPYEHHGFTLNGDYEWNPLEDDGEALRLAVRLRLSISVNDRPMGVVRAYVPDDSVPAIDAPLAGDSYAATRRAIVRAAAEIAKMDGK